MNPTRLTRQTSIENARGTSHSVDLTHVHGCTPVFPLSGGWARYVHINGGVYYYNAERRIITERDVSAASDQHAVLKDWKEFMQTSRDNDMLRYVTPDADAVLRYLPGLSDSGEYDESLELAEAFFICYSDASEVKCPRVGNGELVRVASRGVCAKTIVTEDVSVHHDTYAYWTHIEEYPMHLRGQSCVVLPKATACFWSAITFLSDGMSLLHAWDRLLLMSTDSLKSKDFRGRRIHLTFHRRADPAHH